jgi:hypothetical protein
LSPDSPPFPTGEGWGEASPLEMEIWRYVNMEILYQQADNFQSFNFSIFQSFYGELEGSNIKKNKCLFGSN